MTEPLTQVQLDVLTLLAENGGAWRSRDGLISWSKRSQSGNLLKGLTPHAVSLALMALHKTGYAARIRARHQVEYKITASGRAGLDEARRTGPPDFGDRMAAAIEAAREKEVMRWVVQGAAGGPLSVIVTSQGSIILDCPTEAMKIDPRSGVDGLYLVLEEARAEQRRIERQLYPSKLRQAVRNTLADCPRPELPLRDAIGNVFLVDLRRELDRMEADAEVTRAGACWVLTAKGQRAQAAQ